MAKYRILSLDGGGIRGVITATILEELNKVPTIKNWLDKVDLIAGTSTGGILALALAKGLPPEEIREFYEMQGKEIFDDSWVDDLMDLGQIAGAQYNNRNLERELKKVLGPRTTLGQLQRGVLITSFDLDNEGQDSKDRTWKPKLFHNLASDESDDHILAYKAALYTTAAPTYFPSVDGFIDGGVYANNPSMCALAQSQDRRVRAHPDLSDVVLFSVGTGTSLVYIQGKKHDWGYAQWAKPIIDLMMDGVTGIANFQCDQLLGNRYHRLAPTFDPDVSMPMDAVDRTLDMVSFAEGVELGPTIQWIERVWMTE